MNNRGRLTHVYIQQLFEEPAVEPPKVFVITRGRNSEYLRSRNQKLAYRYYFKSKLKGMSYESLLHELHNEFDISKKTIYNVLFVENHELLKEVMRSKPTVKELRKLYPFYSWQ